MPEGAGLRVTVAWSPAPREVHEVALALPEGSTVAQAVRLSGLLERYPHIGQAQTGIWGRKVAPDQVLADNDRVEIYRDLLVDPKVARRERFQKQGARAAGLFAKRRAGGKAGY